MKIEIASIIAMGMFVTPSFTQDSTPAPVIQIYREVVKEGKNAVHEKAEMDYVRAFRKAKHPGYYLALTSMSGPNEAWFLSPYPSFAVAGDYMKLSEKEPLKSEVDMADAKDGLLREPSRGMWAVLRSDMSYRPGKFKVGMMRNVSLSTFRVRLGKEEDMMSGSKAILAAYEKAGIDSTLICYQVIAGAPSGTYLFFTPMESLATMDKVPARQKAYREAMGMENFQKLMRGTGDIFVSMEANLFAVSPKMSYVSKETSDVDPEFWLSKPSAAPKKPAEKK
jgi:hypothetical protein